MTSTFIIIKVGHENLFGREVSEQQIVQTLAKYPLHQVLELLSKIDILLHVTSQGFDRFGSMQGFLCSNILTGSVLTRTTKKFPNQLCAFFSRGQLNYLKKLALLNCEFNDNQENIWKDLKKREISEVFLGANDITNDDMNLPEDPSEEDMLSFFIRTHFLDQDSNHKSKLIRAYLMFCKFSAPIGGYSDLDTLFLDKIGLKPIEILSICFVLICPFLGNKETLAGKPVILEPSEFFKTVPIPFDNITKVLELIGIDLEELKGKFDIKKTLSGFDLEVFTKKPLLKLSKDDRTKYLCLDSIALIDKFTIGMNWLIGNENELSRSLTSYRGNRFEEYVRHLLKRYCNIRKGNLEFLYIHDFGKNNEELGDAIILDRKNKTVLVFEAKSRQYPDAVKTRGDLDVLTGDLNVAAKQLNEAIEKLKNGGLKEKGIDPSGLRFYPLITFYDTIPSDEGLQRYFRRKFKQNHFFEQDDVAQPEIIGISSIEGAYQLTADLPDILIKKHSTKEGEDAHLGGYVSIMYKDYKYDFLDEELKEVLSEITKRTKLDQLKR